MSAKTTTLFRPVGPKELELIAATGHRRFPPRLPDQPIFYPVCNEQYAIEIAERWKIVGARHHEEYWIPPSK